MKRRAARIKIKNIYPEIEGGRYPVKTEFDRLFRVSADIHRGRKIRVSLKYRRKYGPSARWRGVGMLPREYPRWEGEINFPSAAVYLMKIEVFSLSGSGEKLASSRESEVMVESPRARYAAWYEMFHRSQGKIPGKSATFKDMRARLSDIAKMGFDVIYLPPIHPIGRTNRKGPNNSLKAAPGDPGSPWSVGNEFGGHKAVHPDLGTIDDFRKFVAAAGKKGMDVVLDFTSNCSPDHPWIKEHPDWFFRNPDGTIRYAENPPKKYEDVCPLNLEPEDREEQWNELKSIFTFWIENGVKGFRIDNPHTKPTGFWEWLIREIKADHPEVYMLSEAFTNYDKLEELARVGFSQSYSYFTWRDGKNELLEYFLKLTGSYLKEFLRANLFTNTPDILPVIIQKGGKPAFQLRIVLAATLSSVYGMYNGYELLENEVLPGKKEDYLDSEKYEYKVRDWNKPGNIKDYISRLNRIRRENPALHYYDNLRFYNSTDDNILFYGKKSPDGENVILIAVNLDPFASHTGRVTVPVEEFGLDSDEEYRVRELLTGTVWNWQGRENYITLAPARNPAAVMRLEKKE